MSNPKEKGHPTFAMLKGIDIKGVVEMKGNQSYISWANAWDLLKTNFPDAQRKVYKHEHTGLNYFTDGKTAYVEVGIIAGGIEHITDLPIMDYRNNAIPLEKMTMVDVNKAIQRATAKAIAMHGIGLSMWSGEDLTIEAPVKAEKKKIVLTVNTPNWEKVLAYVANHQDKTLAQIGKELSAKYDVSPAAKKELSVYHKKLKKK
tara:strand:+ start:2159 stop:2767 length:609 start_codon:yes stop_codon:yes gene_type:complete